MNIIFSILAVIVLTVVLLLIIGLFAKKSYALYRDILISRSSNEVFDFIKHLRNQDQFSKWVMTDPQMKRQFRGVDGTVGFIYAWNGNKQAGEGEQEIKSIKDGERIDVEVRFVRPFAGIASTPFVVESVSPHESRVTWGMESSMKYPMSIMLLFVNMNKLLGKDLEISLNNLKKILEKK